MEKRVSEEQNNHHSSHQTNYLPLQHHQVAEQGLHHRNQKWVHLPLTICEALRAFGAEFNCFLPCRSSCTSNNNNNNVSQDEHKESSIEEERRARSENENGGSSCGAAFARWLVSVQDGTSGVIPYIIVNFGKNLIFPIE